MKVLRVITSMDPRKGGPCQGIRNAVPELQKLGMVNDVVCLDAPGQPFLSQDPFKVIALGPAKTPWQYSGQLMPWLLANLGAYDAVVVHGLWQYHAYAVHKAVKQLQKKGQKAPLFFVMPHGMLDPYFQKAESRKLKALRNRLYWTVIESHVVNHADGILFTTKAELMLARTTFSGYHPRKELNIGYGIQQPPVFAQRMKAWMNEHFPLTVSKPYLLFLSRIHPKKGIDLLIRAYMELSENNTELPLLLIAGPGGDTEFGMSLKQMVAGYPAVASRIIFTGMLSGEGKWGAFYGCEAFILPSHQENFGIAVAEALACGKPVIISDQVNIWNEIKEAGAGIIHSDDLVGIKNALSEWLRMSLSDRLMMGQSASAVYTNLYSIEKSAITFRETLGGLSGQNSLSVKN